MTDKPDAVDVLLAVIDVVVECTETTKGEKESWELLLAKAPSIADVMTFNTYRTKAVAIVKTWKAAMAKVANERTYSDDIQKEHIMDIQEDIHAAQKGKGFNVEGWYIHQSGKDGFFRASRKLAGKARCIYIGKNPEKAGEKIQAWNKAVALTGL